MQVRAAGFASRRSSSICSSVGSSGAAPAAVASACVSEGRAGVAIDSVEADVVFGDLPGILDEAIDLMCREAKADAALVVSHSQAGLVEWQKFFEDRGVPVEWRILTYKDNPPLVVSGMNRQLVPGHDDIVQFAAKLVGKLGP